MKKSLPLALITTLLSIAALTSTSTAASMKPAGFYNDCGVKAVQEPSNITQYCADANAGVVNIKWSQWAKTPVGTGTYYINACDPTCVSGKTYKSAARVTLSKLTKTMGKMYYMNVTVTPLPGKAFNWPVKMKPVPTKVTWTTDFWR